MASFDYNPTADQLNLKFPCPHCGNVIDRDFQAALNLKRYGEAEMSKSAS